MAPSCFEVILVASILVLPFLYETSRTFRYYFKFLVYYGVVMVNSLLLTPYFCFRPYNVRNLVWVWIFIYVPIRIFSALHRVYGYCQKFLCMGYIYYIPIQLCTFFVFRNIWNCILFIVTKFMILTCREIRNRPGK